MPNNPTTPVVPMLSEPGVINRLRQGLSIFAMVMTLPQFLAIWVSRRAAGISMLSRGRVPRLCACMVLVRITETDKNIYLPCIGWMFLDIAAIVGALMYP